MLHDGEVVRVQSFDGQPPGVVVEIVLPGVQLAFVHEELAQQRLPSFDDEGQHVGALSSVVVPGLAPVHAVPAVADLDASRYRFFSAFSHFCFLIVMQMYS